jgi:Rieske Fe-S protein
LLSGGRKRLGHAESSSNAAQYIRTGLAVAGRRRDFSQTVSVEGKGAQRSKRRDLQSARRRRRDLGGRRLRRHQPSKGSYKAFSKICTHQGCPVAKVRNEVIHCNCHGSEYSIKDGSVTNPPASKPLAAAKTTVFEGKVYVTG